MKSLKFNNITTLDLHNQQELYSHIIMLKSYCHCNFCSASWKTLCSSFQVMFATDKHYCHSLSIFNFSALFIVLTFTIFVCVHEKYWIRPTLSEISSLFKTTNQLLTFLRASTTNGFYSSQNIWKNIWSRGQW